MHRPHRPVSHWSGIIGITPAKIKKERLNPRNARSAVSDVLRHHTRAPNGLVHQERQLRTLPFRDCEPSATTEDGAGAWRSRWSVKPVRGISRSPGIERPGVRSDLLSRFPARGHWVAGQGPYRHSYLAAMVKRSAVLRLPACPGGLWLAP